LAPALWLERVETRSGRQALGSLPTEQAEEYLMMGLRLSEGVDIVRLPDQPEVPDTKTAYRLWKN
jgi:coproporphyrinogen III oxidase-like Fe-S oxidoreductase